MPQRLDRRLRILRGKRTLRLYPERLRAQEAAVRTKAERRVRTWLRQGRPVVLLTPRWSAPTRFLDDIQLDLAVGAPRVVARALSIAPLGGRPLYESWGWLIKALTEFLGIDLGATAAQAVNRQGFRAVIGQILDRSLALKPHALLIHSAEHLPMEAREDFIAAYQEHAASAGSRRRFTPLIASSVEGPTFEIEGASRLVLPDFAHGEAIEALAEFVGASELARLERVLEFVGGVPALIEQIGADAERSNRLLGDRESIWRALGALGDELRGAVAIADGVDGLAQRIEQLARGSEVLDERVDTFLLRAGLAERLASSRVGLRAPLFADVPAGR